MPLELGPVGEIMKQVDVMSDPIGVQHPESASSQAVTFPTDVSIAIVAHNALRTIEPCIRGVIDSGCPADRITIYDVASTDGTDHWLREHHPQLRVVRMDENRGPNPARNRAVTEASTPYVLVLDADVELLQGTVLTLYKTICEDDSIGITTPVVMYADRPGMVQYRRTYVHYLAEASADVHPIHLNELKGETSEVGLASGCAPLIRVEAARRVGLFEERYFFGKTDGEFAYRMTIGGYRILEPASAQVLHHHTKRGSMYFKHQVANRWHFMLKDYQWRTLITIFPVLAIHEPALFLLLLAKGKAGEYFSAIRMLVRMLPGLQKDRRSIRHFRHKHDWEVLRGDKLVIPADVTRGPLAGIARLYCGLLNMYWSFSRDVLRAISRPIRS